MRFEGTNYRIEKNTNVVQAKRRREKKGGKNAKNKVNQTQYSILSSQQACIFQQTCIMQTIPASRRLVVRLRVEDAQDGEEEVDDVEVEADGGGNLLLDVVLAEDHLGVDEDVGAEDEGGSAAVEQLAGGAVREEHGHEAKHDEAPEGAEEVGHPRGEVVLCLAGEEGEGDEDAAGEDDGVEDDGGLVEGDDDGDGVGLGEGEEGEEEEVGGVGLALPVGEAEEDHGADERDPDDARVGLDPAAVGVAEKGEGADAGGEEQLDGEDGVDFADELVADVDGSFRDGAAKLEGR